MDWSFLFAKEKETYICEICQSKLVEITGSRCPICSRSLDMLEPHYVKGEICFDCFRWKNDSRWKGYLERNISIFVYNDFLQEVMARFKFRGDYRLAYVFSSFLKIDVKDFDYIAPIPLSKERLYERGFNQGEALIEAGGYIATKILTRIHSEKQSKKSRQERIHLNQIFQVDCQQELHNKKVLLIDDIYTTGSTLRHAAQVLKQAGVLNVTSITIARG